MYNSSKNISVTNTYQFEIQDVLLEYSGFGKKMESNNEAMFVAAVLFLGVIIYFSEAFCYVTFFAFVYKHNNGLSILTSEVKKSRNHSNAHTMMGQFYFFVTETIYMLFMFCLFAFGISKKYFNAKDIGVLYKNLEFGLISIVQCLMIPEIRQKLQIIFKKRD